MNNKRTASLLIVSLVFMIWFVGSVGISIYEVKKGNIWIFLIALGQFFIVMGLFALVSIISEKKDGWWLGGVFVLAGTGCVIYGLMNRFGSGEAYKKMVNAIPLMGGITFFIVGLTVVIYSAGSRKKLKECCTYQISAQCIDLKVRGAGYRALRCPIYEAFYNESRILLDKNVYSRGMGNPEKGEKRNLMIDLADVNRALSSNSAGSEGIKIDRYIEERLDKAEAVMTNIIFGSFIIGGCILTAAAIMFIPIF